MVIAIPTFTMAVLHIVLVIYLLQSVASDPESDSEKYINAQDAARMRKAMSQRGDGYGDEWVMMPDGEGQPQVAILKHESSSKFLGVWEGDNARGESATDYDYSQDIHYRLYTKANPKRGQEVTLENPESLKSAGFDGRKPTKYIVHGWKSSGDSTTVTDIKDAYLSRSDVNVVGVDWSNIASNSYYLTPAGETANVGDHVAKMIDTTVSKNGARYEDVHIIGHSLGAHVAGRAGSKTKGKVSRITGLDPALPGFQYWQGKEGRLDDTDASFVEVIHTCAGALGMSERAGHADFYPNGGSPFQPGCCCLAEFTEACSHGRSHQYFAESIKSGNQFQAAPCSTWEDFKSGSCGADTVSMGEATSPRTRGVYYLMTNSSPPYALGPTGAKYFEYEDY